MFQYIDLIVEIIAFIVAIILLQRDIVTNNFEKKYYYIWGGLLIIGMVFLGAIGIIVVALGYYMWSRYIK